jgi:hypothetical protein
MSRVPPLRRIGVSTGMPPAIVRGAQIAHRRRRPRPTGRLVPGTATDGLPLRASPRMGYAPPFNIAADAQTIAVLKGSGGSSSGQPITFSFYEQSFGVAS